MTGEYFNLIFKVVLFQNINMTNTHSNQPPCLDVKNTESRYRLVRATVAEERECKPGSEGCQAKRLLENASGESMAITRGKTSECPAVGLAVERR
jgi:hypothetical protein